MPIIILVILLIRIILISMFMKTKTLCVNKQLYVVASPLVKSEWYFLFPCIHVADNDHYYFVHEYSYKKFKRGDQIIIS